MQIISDNKFVPVLFELPTPSKRGSLRSSVLDQFIVELNKDAGTRYKKDGVWKTVAKVKPSFVAFKLSHLNTSELWYFLSLCKQSRSGFCKCFYGALKTK